MEHTKKCRLSSLLYTNNIAVLYMQVAPLAYAQLHKAAARIQRHIQHTDTLILLEESGLCLIILPATSFVGAQAVARRVWALLPDIEFELQIVYGYSALTLLQRLPEEHMIILHNEQELCYFEDASLPYLAVLAHYPATRLLHLIPYELACHHRCVPVGGEKKGLTLATCQRLSSEIVGHFCDITRKNIFQVRCDVCVIEDVLDYWQRVAVM